jgi:hypothetical protein
VFCLVALGLFAAACGVDDYRFVPDDSGDDGSGDGGPATPTVCGSDADCEGLASTSICDTKSGYCTECIADREEELNRCGEGLYCDMAGHCAIGCATDADCLGLTCDLASHACTGCTSDLDCAPGATCSESACVPGCTAARACPTGFSCCDGLCRSFFTDTSSCGGCGVACEENGSCINGICGPGPCEAGLGECDGDAANGCETDLVSNPTNCGRCRAVCASGLCSGGICTSSDCPEGFADCNQDESDRCEANLSSLENCVQCGKACSDRNGEPSCTSTGCRISCEEGYGDCDDDADTGCEATLATDVDNCGDCGVACVNEHGRTRCVEGECVPTCAADFEDCDADPVDGCEANLGTSETNCGACGARCRPENATGSCVDGVCEAVCDDGFADCNGDPSDGCEADLTSPETCGSCTAHCSDNGGTPVCNAGECGIRCDPGRGDCINGALDGCETNTNVSVLHCGSCDRMCPTAVGTPACFDGVCGVSTCTDPRAECDGDDDTVCETNVTDDPNNCDGCGIECFYPRAKGKCVNRMCAFDRCDPGWGNCDGDTVNGCETALGTPRDCSACGKGCTSLHSTNDCTGTPDNYVCTPSCTGGWLNCTNPDDGCETDANVTGLRGTTGNARVLLSWNAVAAATSYTVRRGTAPEGPFTTTVATGVTGTSTLNTMLTNGTTYYYVVAAVVPCGTGPDSSPVAMRPDGLLVAHYLFDETSGTQAADMSGNGRTATLSGATFAAGHRGNAARIAGGTQRVNLPANIVQGCTDLTIAAWVRLTTNTSDWARIFDVGSSSNVYAMLSPRFNMTNSLGFAITLGGIGGEQRLVYGYTFPTATWKHVAIVLAGNTGRLYLDAVEVTQNTGLTLNPVDLGATPNDWLGDSQYSADPTLDGSIDDFRISCRAYSASEIAALMQ